jgi:hypothetical protein
MPLSNRFTSTANLLKGIGAIIALLPGVATLVGLVQIPPSVGSLVIFLSFFVGFACILIIALLSKKIVALSRPRVAAIVTALILLGSASATEYYLFANDHIVLVDGATGPRTFIKPLRPSRETKNIMEPFQWEYTEALETSSRRFELMDRMNKESGSSVLVLVLLLVIAQAALVTGLALPAWKLSARF